MQKLVLIFACFIGLIAADCIIGTPHKDDLEYCYWYNDNTCCSIDLGNTNNTKFTGCSQIEAGCSQVLNLYGCFLCSPDASTWTTGGLFSTRVNVCSAFGDRMYRSCKGSQVRTGVLSSSCKLVGDVYADGKDFVENFLGQSYTESGTCYNGATGLIASMALLIAAICMAL
eukprot:TRINITY_DN1446_c0_g1_i1.p1 TRINITY_DN1446_c0_g1~~TRINITY_DN1446_c0_g1_i1.p1  ORF type:complete len:171 (-),score=11.12 TRINITY_DN1446_c0_g1_i1:54-566(-)